MPEAPERTLVEATRPTEVRMVEMVFPEQTNHYGTLFGGQALALMDKAAFIVASRFARLPLVTASTEKIDFLAPVKQGQIADLIARVVSTGRASVVAEVELHGEDLVSGERHLAARGRFVLVALDADGKATPVPEFVAGSSSNVEST